MRILQGAAMSELLGRWTGVVMNERYALYMFDETIMPRFGVQYLTNQNFAELLRDVPNFC